VRELDAGAAFEDAHGAIWLPGATSGAGPLRRRAELSAIRAARATAAAARDTALARAAAARASVEAAESHMAAAEDAVTDAARAVCVAEDGYADAERRRDRLERDARETADLVARSTERAAGLSTQLDHLQGAVDEATTIAAKREAAAIAARAAVAAAERDRDIAREAHAAGQVALARQEARLQVAVERERRLADECTAGADRVAALRSELGALASADGALIEQVTAWRLDLAARHAALADVEAQLADSEDAVRVADDAQSEAERSLDTARHEGTALGDEHHRVQLRHAELAGRDRAVRDRVETEWRQPWAALVAECPPLDADEEVLRQDAAALRDEIAALGPVNPLAIEEHAEELKRFDFLTAQRADIAAAQASLHQAIREIDMTARELFLTTFEQVRQHFRQIFLTLFGGGECDLRLENPDAPLDCDIEIHASPRGKRTQRIHLLSTGERALVALSLLFGIFLTKPSPFCLLDEVDAPLDDQNIGRFVRMLNTFKVKTQFIVITHNPRTTTEAADAVYGVTMQEPGVSSLVSVRLRTSPVAAEPPTPAAAGRIRAVRDGAPEPAAVLQGT
jgi:chromosome segregation protein